MENTGILIYSILIEVDEETGEPTGNTKPNIPSDPDYIPPVENTDMCPLPIITWFPLNPICELDTTSQKTGYQIFQQRERMINGVRDGYIEDNVQDINYIAPIFNTTACPIDEVILDPFDYLVVRYIWTAESGVDLDTFTGFINTGTIYDNDWVGYAQGESQVPTIAIQPDLSKSYLRWASDNTTQSGVEAVLINFKQFLEDFSTLNNIQVQLAAIWYNQLLSGEVQIELSTYLDGTMIQNTTTFDFENQGGNIVNHIIVNKIVSTQGITANIIDATIVGTVNYDKITKQAILQ